MLNNGVLVTITNMGESFMLGMLSLAVFTYFLVIGYRREALGVALAFLLPAAVIGLLKIIFYSCDANIYGVISPSGHAAISIGVLGTLALIMAKICSGWWRAILPLALVGLALTIAITRTLLQMHTNGDVIVGIGTGLVSVFLTAKMMSHKNKMAKTQDETDQPNHRRPARPAVLVGIMVGVVLLGYGIKLPSEKLMKSIAKQISPYMAVCLEK